MLGRLLGAVTVLFLMAGGFGLVLRWSRRNP